MADADHAVARIRFAANDADRLGTYLIPILCFRKKKTKSADGRNA
jgi:hypothetical protein